LDFPSQPELAQWCEANALVQDLEVFCFNFSKQRSVNTRHHEAGLLGAAVGVG
jgi:hypothetical protein